MQYSMRFFLSPKLARFAGLLLPTLAVLLTATGGAAQDTPLISGGGGFLTSTNGGNTTYLPIIEPLLAAPLGKRVLVESRAALLESFSPNTNGKSGYDHSYFAGLTYLQGDFIATPHLTVVAGSFLLPFGTYNERLSPIWIGNFQDGPLISNLGLMSTGTGVGGEIRGSGFDHDSYSITYTGYFSARSGNEQFSSMRSFGGQSSLYLKRARLEGGLSYNRSLQGTEENFYGGHIWWEPKDTGFRLRGEGARGHHAQGYWFEADWRLKRFGGEDSLVGRFEPVFRMQQTFRRDTVVSDGLPLANTQRADFGFDYNLPHNTRILTSYARQFSSSGNRNVWETGIVYRFLFPAWKGKMQ